MIEPGHQSPHKRHKNSKYTVEDVTLWRAEMLERGLTLSKYSKEIGISYTTMQRIIDKYEMGSAASPCPGGAAGSRRSQLPAAQNKGNNGV